MSSISPLTMQHLLPRDINDPQKASRLKQQEAQNQKLKDACQDFEAILTSTILKEGLKSATKMGPDDMENGSRSYMDMAYEQIASFAGKNGMMGIGEHLYRSLQMKQEGKV